MSFGSTWFAAPQHSGFSAPASRKRENESLSTSWLLPGGGQSHTFGDGAVSGENGWATQDETAQQSRKARRFGEFSSDSVASVSVSSHTISAAPPLPSNVRSQWPLSSSTLSSSAFSSLPPPPSPTSVSLSPQQFQSHSLSSSVSLSSLSSMGRERAAFAVAPNSAFSAVAPRTLSLSSASAVAPSTHSHSWLTAPHNTHTQSFTQERRSVVPHTTHTTQGATPQNWLSQSAVFTPALSAQDAQCWKCLKISRCAQPCEQCSRRCCATTCLHACSACAAQCCTSCVMVDYSQHFENVLCLDCYYRR